MSGLICRETGRQGGAVVSPTRRSLWTPCLPVSLFIFFSGCGADAVTTPDLTSAPSLDAGLPDIAVTSGDLGGDGRAISDGLGRKTGGGTGMCVPTEDRYIDGDYGTITARDGRSFAVPGPLRGGAACTDLYNPCNGGPNPNWANTIPTIVVDDTPDAVEVTGYLYGDNYFELHVNGKYLCHDALTFVPFNSHVVRFKAAYPMTIAIQTLDWEQSLGVGVEVKNGMNHVGDGGLVARFVDAKGRVVVTSSDWKCRPYYIAPVDDPACVKADRDSSACPAAAACATGNPAACHAVLWDIPADWTAPAFNDSDWPAASRYLAADIGPKTAYTANAALFQGADFIWSKNLAVDNLVLCRRTAPR